MQQKHTYTKEQKLEWLGPGDWIDEPDEVEFEHSDYKCYVIRIIAKDGPKPDTMFGGYFCGYVYLPQAHPFYGKNVFEENIDIDVHGGLTYGEIENDLLKIGFDCAHSGDLVPSMKETKDRILKDIGIKYPNLLLSSTLFQMHYRTIDYCILQCKSMAEQCKKGEIKIEEKKNA